MAVAANLGRAFLPQRITPVPIDLDALVRAGRTLLAGVAVTVGAAAHQAVTTALGHSAYDPATLASATGVAAVMAPVAWAHRLLFTGLAATPSD